MKLEEVKSKSPGTDTVFLKLTPQETLSLIENLTAQLRADPRDGCFMKYFYFEVDGTKTSSEKRLVVQVELTEEQRLSLQNIFLR